MFSVNTLLAGVGMHDSKVGAYTHCVCVCKHEFVYICVCACVCVQCRRRGGVGGQQGQGSLPRAPSVRGLPV